MFDQAPVRRTRNSAGAARPRANTRATLSTAARSALPVGVSACRSGKPARGRAGRVADKRKPRAYSVRAGRESGKASRCRWKPCRAHPISPKMAHHGGSTGANKPEQAVSCAVREGSGKCRAREYEATPRVPAQAGAKSPAKFPAGRQHASLSPERRGSRGATQHGHGSSGNRQRTLPRGRAAGSLSAPRVRVSRKDHSPPLRPVVFGWVEGSHFAAD